MFDLKYHYCKRRMTAYLNGELPPAVRRRVARYIDEHPRCADLYRQQRHVSRELHATMPVFGRPSSADLERVWVGVQAGLEPRQAARVASAPRLRYGVGVLAMIALLWLPLLLANRPVAALAPATQPDPLVQVVAVTASPDETQALVIVQTTPHTVNAVPGAAVVPPGTPPPTGQ